MRVQSVQLTNFRSFVETPRIELATITVLVGANNSGKSSIIKSLHLLQNGHSSQFPDVRAGSSAAQITYWLRDIKNPTWGSMAEGRLTMTITSTDRRNGGTNFQLHHNSERISHIEQIPPVDPDHFIIPYLTKRKATSYLEDVRSSQARQVQSNMSNLAAKLSRIANPGHPNFERYSETCKAVLGFLVTAVLSENGQTPGIYLPNGETLPIDQMGEGVPNIVALLVDLAGAANKLFLIEEPENDLHPSALKALLELIVESSKCNQFVVSTHSNIVLQHLGAAPDCRIYEVDAASNQLPTTTEIRPVDSTPQARLRVLQQLGYSLSDFDLWEGWLFLEEASAERIIRDYLIPWFAPKLTRIRTMSAGGTGNLEPSFEDFNRLTRFTHLEKIYSEATWVRVDGDPAGQEVIQRLRARYQTWSSDRFSSFTRSNFELYYPNEFQERVDTVLAISDKKEKRQAKKDLLLDVIEWLDSNHERAKNTLQISAEEIIRDLKTIESQLANKKH